MESKLKKKQSLLRSFPVFQDKRSFTLAERRGSEPKPWKSPCTPHPSLLPRANAAELEVEKESVKRTIALMAKEVGGLKIEREAKMRHQNGRARVFLESYSDSLCCFLLKLNIQTAYLVMVSSFIYPLNGLMPYSDLAARPK